MPNFTETNSISGPWHNAMKYLKLSSTRTVATIVALLIVIRFYRGRRRLRRMPRLQGPPSQSFLFGVTEKLFPSSDMGGIYQEWEKAYGPVYEIPATMGAKQIILGDPKAIAHFFSKDTTAYHQPALQRIVSRGLYGDLLTAMEGETHKRQRKALSSAFSIAAIRDLTPVFLDSAHELKAAWDLSCQLSEGKESGVTIDVQKWMNYISLDSIGKAGFSHDFGTLKGRTSSVMTALDSFNEVGPSPFIMVYLLIGPFFPKLFSKIRNKRLEKLVEVAATLKVIATDFLNKASRETEDGTFVDRSILGVLIRSESTSSNIRLSTDEIIAQNMFILAGYETTATTLTWAFIELARRSDIQEALRTELRNSITAGEDPTYDQLMNSLPYLDAFVCEILRLHPPLPQAIREAGEDDIIPLMDPIRTASGTMIESLFVEKGTAIRVPLVGVNMSEDLWGPDARVFDPGRWLVPEINSRGRRDEVKGHRNLLTFAHGPRMCLARHFALTEIKAVVSVLVRNFTFEFPNGPSTKLGSHFLRPKVAGEEALKVPVLVRRVT